MQDDDGDQPIHEAAKSANIDVLQHLIVKYEVDPRIPGKVLLQLQLYIDHMIWSLQSGMQPIHYAASNGCAEVLTTLIDHFEVDPAECSSVSIAYHWVAIILCGVVVGSTATTLCCYHW